MPQTADIITQRLRLRTPEQADAEWIAAEIARPAVHRMLSGPPYPFHLHHAEEWIADAIKAGGHFVIEADQPIGVVSLRRHIDDGEFGYWLIEPAWGNGYMTEAGAAVLDRHFAEYDDPVPSGHFLDNPGSGNVLRKLGFQNTELRKAWVPFRKSDVTVQKMILTAVDWRTRATTG